MCVCVIFSSLFFMCVHRFYLFFQFDCWSQIFRKLKWSVFAMSNKMCVDSVWFGWFSHSLDEFTRYRNEQRALSNQNDFCVSLIIDFGHLSVCLYFFFCSYWRDLKKTKKKQLKRIPFFVFRFCFFFLHGKYYMQRFFSWKKKVIWN